MDKKMSLVEHLTDLRKALIYPIISIIICSAISYSYVDTILAYLKQPLPIQKLVFFGPVEAFLVNLKIALLGGLVLAFPIIISFLAWFITPGLTKKEKRLITVLGFLSTLFFILGASIAYFGALPLTLKFLFNFTPENILPYVSISYYVSFIINFILVFGLSFQFPFLLFVLIVMGLATPSFFRQQRKYVLLIIISASFILAPSADLITQFLLFGPLYVLFELSVLFGGFFRKKIYKP